MGVGWRGRKGSRKCVSVCVSVCVMVCDDVCDDVCHGVCHGAWWCVRACAAWMTWHAVDGSHAIPAEQCTHRDRSGGAATGSPTTSAPLGGSISLVAAFSTRFITVPSRALDTSTSSPLGSFCIVPQMPLSAGLRCTVRSRRKCLRAPKDGVGVRCSLGEVRNMSVRCHRVCAAFREARACATIVVRAHTG